MSVTVQIYDGPLCESIQPPPLDGGGACLRFEGIVRPEEDGAAIDGLCYEVYEPMAVKQLQYLARQAMQRFGLLAIGVEHSRGFVPVGGCSFRLWVLSAHRKEGLQAMDWFIDTMKCDVPIWKSVPKGSPV